jgi:hypothetical protein
MAFRKDDKRRLAAEVEKRLDEELGARKAQEAEIFAPGGRKSSKWHDPWADIPTLAKIVAALAVICLGVFLPIAAFCQNNPEGFASLTNTACPEEGGCSSCRTALNALFRDTTGYSYYCEDSTRDYACSKNRPFKCLLGKLKPKASECGCPAHYAPSGDTCAKDPNYFCEDGSHDGQCSATQPFKCIFGRYAPKASECGCPQGESVSGETCAKIEIRTVIVNRGGCGRG